MSRTSRTKRIGVVTGAVAIAVAAGTGTVLALGADQAPAPTLVPADTQPGPAPAAQTQVVPNSYIVVFRDTVTKDAVVSTAGELVSRHGGEVRHVYQAALPGFSVQATEQQKQELAKDPRVKFVEPNKRIGIPE